MSRSIIFRRNEGHTAARRPRLRSRPRLEDLEGRQLLAMTYPVYNTSDYTPGPKVTPIVNSLRWAITQADANPGSTISFKIGSGGVQTINLLTALPVISQSVTIDGTTQPGYTTSPLIVLDGAKAPSTAIGLEVQASNSVIKGLDIEGFNGGGVILDGTSGDHGDSISNDYIGVTSAGNAAGNADADDGALPIELTDGANKNSITTDLISNNDDGGGVHVVDGSYGNLIQGNKIGTDVTGTKALPNGGSGVLIDGGSYGNTVGGTTAAARNIISGNAGDGVHILGAGTEGNVVEGNYIGTDAYGKAALPNTGSGVNVDGGASADTVGGTTAAARNIISGNLADGVNVVAGSNSNLVEGNFIGTDVNGYLSGAGVAPLGNGIGVLVDTSNNNVIGGTSAGAGNTIAGNLVLGVKLQNEDATNPTKVEASGGINNDDLVEGNSIIQNLGSGVLIDYGSGYNTIGGTATGAGNTISGNLTSGVSLSTGTAGLPANFNLVEGNSITANISGVLVEGSNSNTIGGTAAGAGNTIAANTASGVHITDSYTNNNLNVSKGDLVEGNQVLGNGGNGVQVDSSSTGNTIGGAAAGAGNTIESNGLNGVYLLNFGSNNVVEGDTIDSNMRDGVYILGASSVPTLVENDTVDSNFIAGICLNGNSATTVTSCTIEYDVDYGIWLEGGSAATLKANTAIRNGSGTSDNVYSG